MKSYSNEATGAYVFRLPFNRWSLFALAGTGAIIFDAKDMRGVGSQARAAGVYGGGIDADITSHLFVRAEYRGLVYNSPTYDLPVVAGVDRVTHRFEPSVGFRRPAIKDFVPLARLEDLEVACWDIFDDNAYEAAVKAGVLEMSLLEQLKEPLSAIKPMQAVFDQKFVKRINGPNIMSGGSKMDYAERVMDDIRKFKERTGVTRMTMIWCGSTEVYHEAAPVHATLKDFECGLQKNDPEISPSQIYAYAALKMGDPLRQRRAAPDHRYAGAAGTGPQQQCAGLRQGLQERPDVHEDADGSRA